jgi:hypothetical protein
MSIPEEGTTTGPILFADDNMSPLPWHMLIKSTEFLLFMTGTLASVVLTKMFGSQILRANSPKLTQDLQPGTWSPMLNYSTSNRPESCQTSDSRHSPSHWYHAQSYPDKFCNNTLIKSYPHGPSIQRGGPSTLIQDKDHRLGSLTRNLTS